MGNLIRFGELVLDLDRRQLSRRGEAVAIQPKVMKLLALLLEHHPAAVPKRKIYETLWPDVIVEEANVHNLIADLRALLGDEGREWIRTVHRFGYAFAGPVERSSAWELRLGDRRIVLRPGENIVGRDDDVDVRIDEPGVSRRHARIVIADSAVFVEDLGSKNGTTVDAERTDGATRAGDGAEVLFGSVRTILRRVHARAETVTL